MDNGLVYRSPALYRLAMRVLDSDRKAREQLVVDAIAPGSAVVDLCCGDAPLASELLAKDCTYLGLDLNPQFVADAVRRDLDARVWNARTDDIPEADVVVMLSSLYQFIPDERAFVGRLLAAARELVVLAEPIRNWATSDSRALRAMARRLTRVDGRAFESRLGEGDLDQLADVVAPGRVRKERLAREVVLFLDAR
jgi:trans-aconitate methyltransferase